MTRPRPLMVIGDDPTSKSGLGRIGRDLATLISRMPEFRVGYLARAGQYSRQLPFAQYVIRHNPTTGEGQWGEWSLPEAWRDFSPRERGIVFSVWDTTRMFWFARPGFMETKYVELRTFLEAGHFERWGYFPIDAVGPNNKLTAISANTLIGYDRRLAYTAWARDLMESSTGIGADWLPHGINMDIFQPADKIVAKRWMAPEWHDDDYVVGIVMTNQMRKDWGLAIEACAALRDHVRNLRVWCHIDTLERHWSLPALLADFGLQQITTITHDLTDTEMALAYSASDVIINPSPEGFGYAIAESLACGTPVVHMNYAGGASLVQVPLCGRLVEPAGFRLETPYNCYRPTFDVIEWVKAVLEIREQRVSQEICRASIEHLDWKNLWPSVWKKWMLRGLPA